VAEEIEKDLARGAAPAGDAAAANAPAGDRAQPIDRTALTRTAGRGGLWQVGGLLWQTIVQYGTSMVLMRLLAPENYGMYGMALLAQGLISRIGVLGTTSGVIAKQDATEDDLSSAFWLSAGVQAALFLIAFAAAPLAAIYFKTDDVTWVMRATAVTFLFSAVGATSSALLAKRLQFAALKIIEGGAFAVQMGSAIILAICVWKNYWALVMSMLVGSLAATVATVAYARWLPRLRVRAASLRYMFRYGIHGLGASLTDYFHHNIDYMVVGRLLGQGSLGIYQVAFAIPHMVIDRLAVPVGNVVFPTLAKVQESDEALIGGYMKVTRYLAFLVFPMMGGMAAVAEPAILVLGGEKWLGVVGPLQILCIRVAAACICTCIGYVFLCRNRPDLIFKYGLVTAGFTIVVVVVLGYLFGLYGVAWGMVISLAPNALIIRKAFRMTHTPVRKLVATLVPPAVTAAASSAAAFLVCQGLGQADLSVLVGFFTSHGAPAAEAEQTLRVGGPVLDELVRLVASVATGAAAYLAVMRVFFADSMRDVWETVRVVFARSPRTGVSVS